MSYSMTTMRAALKAVGSSKGVNPFIWEEKKGGVDPHLSAKFPFGRSSQNYLNDLLEYCWLVYEKSLRAGGAQKIGRTNDLWVPEHLEKVGIDPAKQQTLWDNHIKGNIQKMDKWAPTVNDCWVLGGVHRRADFELLSARKIENLWDFQGVRHVVTGREILGLIHFGYVLEKQPTRVRFVCKNAAAAQGATIEAYDAHMKIMEAKGPATILSILK
jgi:hypothetical protein